MLTVSEDKAINLGNFSKPGRKMDPSVRRISPIKKYQIQVNILNSNSNTAELNEKEFHFQMVKKSRAFDWRFLPDR